MDGIEEYKHDADGGAACHLLLKYKRNTVIRGLLPIDVCILSDDASRLSDASDLSDLSFESGDDSVTLDLQTANCSCTTGLPKFGARDTAAQGGIASRG